MKVSDKDAKFIDSRSTEPLVSSSGSKLRLILGAIATVSCSKNI